MSMKTKFWYVLAWIGYIFNREGKFHEKVSARWIESKYGPINKWFNLEDLERKYDID